jgi:copper chaperone CopZ
MLEVQSLVLSVPDISCHHCVKAINSSLNALNGVENIQTDIETKTVRLRYHPNQVTIQQIEKTLDESGYTVAR